MAIRAPDGANENVDVLNRFDDPNVFDDPKVISNGILDFHHPNASIFNGLVFQVASLRNGSTTLGITLTLTDKDLIDFERKLKTRKIALNSAMKRRLSSGLMIGIKSTVGSKHQM